jgi:hypothetical protein
VLITDAALGRIGQRRRVIERFGEMRTRLSKYGFELAFVDDGPVDGKSLIPSLPKPEHSTVTARSCSALTPRASSRSRRISR